MIYLLITFHRNKNKNKNYLKRGFLVLKTTNGKFEFFWMSSGQSSLLNIKKAGADYKKMIL